jgi:dephospho-CoA kinase
VPKAATPSRRRRRVVAVGLTGGIGAGKSTALMMFRELGAVTISADAIVHDLYGRTEFVARLREHFGQAAFDERNQVDRRRLSALVRGRPQELRWLEALTHPLVAQEIERFVGSAPEGAVAVCEVPLLFEAGYEGLFDLIVTIEAAHEHRLSRSQHRFHPESFREFEQLQATTERRTRGSHLAFCNDGDLAAMREFVARAFARAQELLQETPA